LITMKTLSLEDLPDQSLALSRETST